MRKYYNFVFIVVIGISVVASAVFAARIPPMWFGFALSSLLILAATVLLRLNSKKELNRAQSGENPLTYFGFLLQNQVDELETFLVLQKKDNAWVDKLENSLEHFYVELEETRPALLEMVGMKNYVALMSSFAMAERLLNRGLSAGIDGYMTEAQESLTQAEEMLRISLTELEKQGAAAFPDEAG